MEEMPEYRDLKEIRDLLKTFRSSLNEINLHYARTDFRADQSFEEADPFIITDLIRMTDRLILLHKDINQSDIIRLLLRLLLDKLSPGDISNICRKLKNRKIHLSEHELIRQSKSLTLSPEALHAVLSLLI